MVQAKSTFAQGRKAILLLALAAVLVIASGGLTAQVDDPREPGQVVRAYLRAVYARDFAAAYRLISSEDRQVRDLDRYMRQHGAFSGFVLEAARKLSESVETDVAEQAVSANRARLRVRYRVPDSKAIGPVLLNWDPYRLNALNGGDRAQLLAELSRRQQERALELASGEEIIELVKEGSDWRIFLDWRAGVTIPFRLEPPADGALRAAISKPQVNLQPGDVFEILLKVENTTSQPIVARISHLVEPRDAADYLEFVQCGFLLPVTIPAGAQQEYSGTYLLRGSLPEGIRELKLTYDFKVLD